MVETQADDILHGADKENVSLLVVGDPFGCVHIHLHHFSICLRFLYAPFRVVYYIILTRMTVQRRTSTSYSAHVLPTFPSA